MEYNVSDMTSSEVYAIIFAGVDDKTPVSMNEVLALNIINKGQHLEMHLRDWAYCTVS